MKSHPMTHMLRESILVTALTPETIRVSRQQKGACQSCQLKPACGEQFLQAIPSRRDFLLPRQFLHGQAEDKLLEGQELTLELGAASLVRLSLLLYFLPLVLMFPVMLLFEFWEGSELATVLAAFATLGLSYGILHRLLPKQFLSAQLKLFANPRSVQQCTNQEGKVLNHEEISR